MLIVYQLPWHALLFRGFVHDRNEQFHQLGHDLVEESVLLVRQSNWQLYFQLELQHLLSTEEDSYSIYISQASLTTWKNVYGVLYT